MNSVKLSLLKWSNVYNHHFQQHTTFMFSERSNELFLGCKNIRIIANCLTLIEFDTFSQLQETELFRKGWQHKDRGMHAPTLTQLAERFDHVFFFHILFIFRFIFLIFK